MTKAEEDARVLIESVKSALANGTKHYNKAGKLLETPLEIIDCLLEEGSITFEPRKPS